MKTKKKKVGRPKLKKEVKVKLKKSKTTKIEDFCYICESLDGIHNEMIDIGTTLSLTYNVIGKFITYLIEKDKPKTPPIEGPKPEGPKVEDP